MNKRQENALKTKRKLVEAATDFIIKGDFNDLKVEDITKACGCAKGTFYIYFKNKDEIGYEVCRNLFNRIEARMQQMTDSSFPERLAHYFDSFMIEVERYGINVCREWIRCVIDPNLASEDVNNTKWQFDVSMLQKILEQAVRKGELKNNTPVVILTHIIICELYGMMTCWCMSDGVFEPKNWTNKVFNEQIMPMLKQYVRD